MTVSDYLKTASSGLTSDDALRSPVDVLMGVSSTARSALAAVNIATVFDLAVSQLFATAAALTAAETDATTLEARLNGAAADAVVPPPGLAVGEWARQGLSILAGLDAAAAAALEAALSAQTVRDLALWPPFAEAKAILADALGATQSAGDDGTPADLLPKSGVYPTERVFFTKLLIDATPQAAQGTAPLEQAGAIDLGSALSAPTAFQRIATGALATFRQSWYSEGVTLGQLLHSLTLAPGESTRIAMIDWSRQVGASVTEQIDEREQLASTQTHNRALTEVTDATASEFQSGSSTSHVDSSSSQEGGALGLDIGPFALGGSAGGGSSKTTATSASSSFGARDMAASLAQNINDRTQQNASDARSRRASIVSEVSQSEHEAITTRIVTNYNHMHALNVQYFELVQAYRVTTELDRVERCLFVPLQLLDFGAAGLVSRLRSTLAQAALTGAAYRQLTTEFGAVELIPRTPRIFPGHVDVGRINDAAAVARSDQPSVGLGAPIPAAGHATSVTGASTGPVAGTSTGIAVGASTATPASTGPAVGASTGPGTPTPTGGQALSFNDRIARAPSSAPITLAAAKGWDLQQVVQLGSLMTGVPLRPGSDSVFVADDAQLLSFALRDGQAAQFQVRKRDNSVVAGSESGSTSFVLAAPTAIADLQAIAVQSGVDRDVTTTLALNFSMHSTVVTLDVPIQFRSHAAVPGMQDVVGFGAVGPSPDLIAHLEANRLHYSRAVYADLDPATVAGILAQFTYRGLPLTRVVDPQPVTLSANFLVFRMNVPREGDPDDPHFAAEQQDFRAFLTSRGLDSGVAKSEIVPLPTGGVFAEAVLGRFNAAEKIDLQRFWNWQDSPIPIAAPDIAPISAGSRAEADTTTPGQLGAPILTVQAPSTLPAAAGVAPILAAIQNANAFRDMSGAAQTAALAQAAVTTSGAGASAAGDQAAKNLFTVMDEGTQRMKIAADLAGSMYGAKAGSSQDKGAQTVSERGGQVNAAESLGKAAATGGAAGAATGGSAATGSGPAAAAAAATPSAGAQPAATLQGQTLAQQSGSAAADVANSVVAAATKPDTGTTTTTPAPKPKPPATTTTPPATPPVPLPFGLPVATTARNVRLTVFFDDSDGVKIGGSRQMHLYQGGLFSSQLLIEVAAGPGQALLGGFLYKPDAPGALTLAVTAAATPDAGPLSGSKTIVVSTEALLADIPKLEVHVQPVVKRKTFAVPGTPPFMVDMSNLEQQLTDLGVPKDMRVGDPTFAVSTTGFTATVTYFSGELIVKQVL